MAVKRGYKQTEVGVIPEDWSALRLASVSAVISKGTTPTTIGRPYTERGVTFLKVEAITESGQLDPSRFAYIDATTHQMLRRSQLQAGDILFSIAGALGRTALVTEQDLPANINQALAFIRLRPDEPIECRYLVHYLRSDSITKTVQAINVQAAQANLSLEQVRNFQVAIPPLPEQRAIATALSDVDDLIASLDRLIAKKRDLKQAAMQQLLTGKTRLPGFRGDWQAASFGDLFAFLRTANNPRSHLTDAGTVGYIHYGEVHATTSAFLDCDDPSLPRIDAMRVHGASLVEDGDLVMADASEDVPGIGKSVEIRNPNRRPVVAGLHTFLLRGNRDLLADGFKGYLQYLPAVRNGVARLATGISVYGISKQNVRSVEVRIPERQEQAAIAEVLSDMDAEIAALEARRDKTKLLKQGMMQELLTGRTRLV